MIYEEKERLDMRFNMQDGTSHLFLVRLRSEEIGECLQPENRLWRGRVQRVVTGETYDFRGWAELIKRLGTMLDDRQAGTEIDE
jgi:hypothetical protein